MTPKTAETLDDLTEVTSEHQEAHYQQTIVLKDKERIPEVLIGIHQRCSDGKFTGRVMLNYNQGGMSNITTTETAPVSVEDPIWPFNEGGTEKES